jgi:hypothetical protein
MPVMAFEKYRQTLHEFTNKLGLDGMKEYGIKKNYFSIDGLPSLNLLRHDGAKDGTKIIPSPADGYIFGKVVEESGSADDSESYSTDSKPTTLRAKQSSSTNNNNNWSWLSFLCGTLLGSVVATIVFSQYIEMEALGRSFTEIGL